MKNNLLSWDSAKGTSFPKRELRYSFLFSYRKSDNRIVRKTPWSHALDLVLLDRLPSSPPSPWRACWRCPGGQWPCSTDLPIGRWASCQSVGRALVERERGWIAQEKQYQCVFMTRQNRNIDKRTHEEIPLISFQWIVNPIPTRPLRWPRGKIRFSIKHVQTLSVAMNDSIKQSR